MAATAETYGTCGLMDTIPFQGKTDMLILYESLKPAGFSEEDIKSKLEVLKQKARPSLAMRVAPSEWPGPPGGPRPLIDANIIRDVPFALYALHLDDKQEK